MRAKGAPGADEGAMAASGSAASMQAEMVLGTLGAGDAT